MKSLILRINRSILTALISSLVVLITSTIPLANAASTQEIEELTPFSEAELEQMLAPIALYPDSLLTHILIAATYPIELIQAERLHSKNTLLPTAQLMEKAEKKDWDPSVTALLAFPNVLEKLSSDLSWTQDLGDAFLQDEAKLLASIQSLRAQADEADSLSEMENMAVTRVNNQIVIEPVQKEIIYVPYYDPRTVYGNWRWYNYPPVYWAPYPYYVGRPHGQFYWNSGVQISFNFFFSAFHWSNHRVVVIDHHRSHHYRHRGRIVTSHGSQKWHHKPQHRRGVAYRNNHVKQRYNSHRPSVAHSKQLRHSERQLQRNSLAHNNVKHSVKNTKHYANQDKSLKHYNKQVSQHREQKFANKLHNSHKPTKPSHKPERISVKRTDSYRDQQREIKIHQQRDMKSHQLRDIKSHQQVKSRQPQRNLHQPKSQQAQRSMHKQQREHTQQMRSQQPRQVKQSAQRSQQATQQRAQQQRSQHKAQGHSKSRD